MNDLERIMQRYEGYLRIEKGLSANTAAAYCRDVDHLVRYLNNEDKKFEQVTESDLEGFLATLHDVGIAPRSQARIISGIKSFFRYLLREQLIDADPTQLLPAPRMGRHLPEVLTLDEIDRMIACIDLSHPQGQRNRAIIEVLYGCGLRVSELVELRLSQVFEQEEYIVVVGKGDKQRKVYFDARTKIHLQKYVNSRTDTNEALFVSLLAPNERLQISGVEIRLRRLGRELNIPKVHPHKFRRTLATMAIDKGMPIEQVQHLLGHQSLDTTLQYAMVNQNNVKLSHHKFIG